METDSFNENQPAKTEEEFDLDAFLKEYRTPEQDTFVSLKGDTTEPQTTQSITDDGQSDMVESAFNLDAFLAKYLASSEEDTADAFETTLPAQLEEKSTVEHQLSELVETNPAENTTPQTFSKIKLEEEPTEKAIPAQVAESAFSVANNIEFGLQFRGYSREQVDDYIGAISEDYNAICETCEELQAENKGLRRALAKLEGLTNLDEQAATESDLAGVELVFESVPAFQTEPEYLDVDLVFEDIFPVELVFNEAMLSAESEPLPHPVNLEKMANNVPASDQQEAAENTAQDFLEESLPSPELTLFPELDVANQPPQSTEVTI